MKDAQPSTNRRSFIKLAGLSAIPLALSGNTLLGAPASIDQNGTGGSINFVYDGLSLFLSPANYVQKLTEISNAQKIQPDFYGAGGTTQELENEFARITGKEKAIYLPSGTMANQLAIKLLNQEQTKAIVPENSHIYRDEADAAQAVHNQRLIPLGKGKDHFDLDELKETIAYHKSGEYIDSGLGTVVIENPVRRANGAVVPISEIKRITDYCRKEGYKLHLDGARLHIASAYTGISVAEYSSLFDTVYISLYKYLNAAGGAMLCGDASLIDKVSHLIKIHGGTAFQSWVNTGMALYYLKGIDGRWKELVKASDDLISQLNKTEQVRISKKENGTNLYDLKLRDTNFGKLQRSLSSDHNMMIAGLDGNGNIRFAINESLLQREIGSVASAWKACLKAAKV